MDKDLFELFERELYGISPEERKKLLGDFRGTLDDMKDADKAKKREQVSQAFNDQHKVSELKQERLKQIIEKNNQKFKKNPDSTWKYLLIGSAITGALFYFYGCSYKQESYKRPEVITMANNKTNNSLDEFLRKQSVEGFEPNRQYEPQRILTHQEIKIDEWKHKAEIETYYFSQRIRRPKLLLVEAAREWCIRYEMKYNNYLNWERFYKNGR